ncbi:MAG: DUF1080 domain-containing protein, partial [Burkholderiales bacterium]|nr:DUF1080 domain-containing protein [Opitutaceae bacterium]
GDPLAADPVDRESSAVQAAACFYPPTDYLNWFTDGDNAVGIGRLAEYAAAFGPRSATPEGREKLGRELSSIYWVKKDQPPVYIVHGDADPNVSVTQARRFFDRATEVGAKCEVLVRAGAGHGGWAEMPEDVARMAEWFDQHLLGKAPARPFTYTYASAPSTPAPKPVALLNELTPAEKSAGWRLLFDGKTTAGWRGYRGTEMPPKWEVVDGALTLQKFSAPGQPGGEGTGIVTVDTFADFDLRWEWKMAPGGNSGVMYRVSEELEKPHQTGPEYQLVDAVLHPDGKQSPLKWSAACYGMYAPPRDLAAPSGEWNTARILVRGPHVEHWLNGQLAAKFQIGNEEWNQLAQAGKWKTYPRFAREVAGLICFQDHGHTIAFRNIKILPFAPVAPTAASTPAW